MVEWVAHLAATLEDLGFDVLQDLDAHLLLFLFGPVCRTSKIVQSSDIIISYLALNKIVTNPTAVQ